MGNDVLFREETETIEEAVEVLTGERSEDFSWRLAYEKLLGRYTKLFSQSKRLTRIGDLMQNDLNRLNLQLTESNEFQAQLLSTAPAGIVTVDSHHVITKVGDAFILMSGLERDELIGRRFEDLEILSASRADGELPCTHPAPVFGAECTMQARDGRMLRLLANSAPIRDASGNVVGGIIAFVDVTELIEAREAAKAADQAKSEFLARMSHEIRTPMNAILGFTEVMLGEDISEVQRDSLSAVKRGGTRLLALLNDILDLSKIEADKMELASRVLDLESIVFDAIEMARPIAEEKGLELLCDVPRFPRELIGDPTRIQQILVNLLSNAMKFTQQGEVVTTVRLREETEDRVSLSFSVTDTGMGIPEDKLECIFEAFTQADGSATRRFGGTGLGLAICRRLVQMMGGTICVDSTPEHGSRFQFDVWLDKGEPRRDRTDKEVGEGPLQGKTILIVDDNQTSLDIICNMCRGLGITPVCVTSLDRAWQQVMEGDYDAVFVDAEMSRADTHRFAGRIKEQFHNERPAVIALTAYTRRQRVLSGPGSSFDGALLKPVRMSSLIRAIASPRDDRQEFACAPHEPARGKVCRILLAEDDLLSQKLAVWMLTKLGHEPHLAEDGEQALAMARTGDYDLILMDVHMPLLDGTQVARALRDLGKTTPIIGVTAAVMAEDIDRCIDAGMNDFIAKPVDRDNLAAVIAKYCDVP
jgi:two-component system sensor histidine kinase/response regulator